MTGRLQALGSILELVTRRCVLGKTLDASFQSELEQSIPRRASLTKDVQMSPLKVPCVDVVRRVPGSFVGGCFVRDIS